MWIEDYKPPSKLKRWYLNWRENRYYIKDKCCCACRHFGWFMGSAGVCEAKTGCCTTRMKDFSDSCDCGMFKVKTVNNILSLRKKG